MKNGTFDPLSENRDPLDTIKTETNADVETGGISMGEIKEESIYEEHDLESVQLKTKGLQCEACPFKAPTRHKLARHHKSVHTKIRDFICNDCDFASAQKGHLDVHRRTVHEGIKPHKKFVCDLCGKACFSKRDLKAHIINKHVKKDVKTHKCEKCGFETANKEKLQKHLTKVHEGIGLEKTLNCYLCEKVFSIESYLKRHIERTHESTKDFICDECGHATSRKENLVKHVRSVHLKIREYQCHTCEKTFGEKCTLEEHIMAWHFMM